MFGERKRFEARVADALSTFTIEELRQLVAEVEAAPVELLTSPANDNQLAWPYIPFPETD
jgi:hypothetical protein